METLTKQAQQTVRLRPGAAGDAEVLGQICYEAFRHISEAHGFPRRVAFLHLRRISKSTIRAVSHP
jgi:hypothetical protein